MPQSATVNDLHDMLQNKLKGKISQIVLCKPIAYGLNRSIQNFLSRDLAITPEFTKSCYTVLPEDIVYYLKTNSMSACLNPWVLSHFLFLIW
ncbi:hypothetical protein C8Q75DRAFT_149635 [Abortiporus biennis]|nr:hypothetical protein C8Q75DRAFT_149635 [Abortiporus biennis]